MKLWIMRLLINPESLSFPYIFFSFFAYSTYLNLHTSSAMRTRDTEYNYLEWRWRWQQRRLLLATESHGLF